MIVSSRPPLVIDGTEAMARPAAPDVDLGAPARAQDLPVAHEVAPRLDRPSSSPPVPRRRSLPRRTHLDSAPTARRAVRAGLQVLGSSRPAAISCVQPAGARHRTTDANVGGPKQRESATCRACQPTAGAANGNWRGGRTLHKAGYVMRRAPAHPRSSNKTPYVFEHILVMEELLGRYLTEGESVHHQNGVRDDNRPENLELWVRPQPPGIRAEDAVAWAREILARYDDMKSGSSGDSSVASPSAGTSGSSRNAQALD